MFAFVLAHVARKPFNVDVVFVCKMFFQMSTGFAFDIVLVTRKPFDVDVVLEGKVLF